MRKRPTEAQVVAMWRRVQLGAGLATEAGEPVRVLYPGRPNDGRGGDFCDAVVASKEVAKGDIEVHVRAGDWQAHGHHRDPAYDRVVLHVAMWNDGARTTTTLSSGESVPVLALHRFAGEPGGRQSAVPISTVRLPCARVGEQGDIATLTRAVEEAGGRRFAAKTAAFREDMAARQAGQCLYRGLMGALGYAKNSIPMMSLAERLPLARLEAAARDRDGKDGLSHLEMMLLGAAGLPSPHPGVFTAHEEAAAPFGSFSAGSATMSHGDWHLFKVRPGNSPERRILAMGHLLCRYRDRGLLTGMLGLVGAAGGHRELEAGLIVKSVRPGGTALLGPGRVGVMVVNVLLPFSRAWAQANDDAALAQKALSLYDSYPRVEENGIERHLRDQLGLGRNLVNSARRQQGLLDIYRSRCTQGECLSCPMNRT